MDASVEARVPSASRTNLSSSNTYNKSNTDDGNGCFNTNDVLSSENLTNSN